jgi:hypothetical protein
MAKFRCPDCEHEAPLPESELLVRCVRCGFQIQAESADHLARMAIPAPVWDGVNEVMIPKEPIPVVYVRLVRGLPWKICRARWQEVDAILKSTSFQAYYREHRYNPGPLTEETLSRLRALPDVAEVRSGVDRGGPLWYGAPEWFVRVKVVAKKPELLEDICELLKDDVLHDRGTREGGWLLKVLEPPLPAQMEAVRTMEGVERITVHSL